MKESYRRKMRIALERLPHQEHFSISSCRVSFLRSQQLKVELKVCVWIHHRAALIEKGDSILSEGVSGDVREERYR